MCGMFVELLFLCYDGHREKVITLIRIENCHVAYQDKLIFECNQLTIEQGQIILLTGKSGSGKTTLLNLISLNIIDANASYTIDGTIVSFQNRQQIQFLQRCYFSYVFQDYALFSSSTVW